MWPDQVSNPGPLTYESGALPNALRGPAQVQSNFNGSNNFGTIKRCSRQEFFELICVNQSARTVDIIWISLLVSLT